MGKKRPKQEDPNTWKPIVTAIDPSQAGDSRRGRSLKRRVIDGVASSMLGSSDRLG